MAKSRAASPAASAVKYNPTPWTEKLPADYCLPGSKDGWKDDLATILWDKVCGWGVGGGRGRAARGGKGGDREGRARGRAWEPLNARSPPRCPAERSKRATDRGRWRCGGATGGGALFLGVCARAPTPPSSPADLRRAYQEAQAEAEWSAPVPHPQGGREEARSTRRTRGRTPAPGPPPRPLRPPPARAPLFSFTPRTAACPRRAATEGRWGEKEKRPPSPAAPRPPVKGMRGGD